MSENLRRLQEEHRLKNLGNGFVTENLLDKIELLKKARELDQKDKESSNNKKRSKVETRKAKKKVNEQISQVNAKLSRERSRNEVFNHSVLDSLYQATSVFDRFVSAVITKLQENGKLDIIKNRNNIILEEERQRNNSNCYKFIHFITANLKKGEVSKFALDSAFYPYFESVINSPRFKKYEFKVIHQTVIEEPSIIQVCWKGDS